MAVRDLSITDISTAYDKAHIARWTGLTKTTDDTGSPLEMVGSADRSVQVEGVFNGGTLLLEGSNDGSNYATLTDPQGNNLSFTSATIETVAEITRYVRPRVTAGGGSTNLAVTMLVRRNK